MKQVIQIRCKNNKKTQKVAIGSTLFDIFSEIGLEMSHGPISCKVNNKVEGMHYRVYNSKDLEFLDMTSSSGSRAYTRTLFFVLCKAVKDIFPASPDVIIDIPVSNGFYVDVRLGKELTEEVVGKLRNRMQEIIDAHMPIRRYMVPTEDAIALFQEKGDVEKVKLLKTSGSIYTTYYKIGDYVDYYYGTLLTNTSGWRSIMTVCCCVFLLLRIRISWAKSPDRIRCLISSRSIIAGRISSVSVR